MVSQSDKELFNTIFSNNGRLSWTIEYKKQYISKLRSENELKITDLPESIVLNKSAGEIFKAIETHDPGLKFFKSFYKKNEIFAKKQVEIYKTEFTDTDISNLRNVEEKDYDFSPLTDWGLIGIDKTDTTIIYTFAKSSQLFTHTKLSESSLDSETWAKILNKAKESTSIFDGKLLFVDAQLVSPKRIILRLDIDLKKKFLDISCDNDTIDEDGKRVNPTMADGERKRAVAQAIKTLPIDLDTQKRIIEQSQNGTGIFTSEVLQKLSSLQELEMIVISTIHKFDSEDKNIPEKSERLTTDLHRQRINEIKKKIAEHYEGTGSLDGFFQANPQHDTKNAKYTSQFSTNSDVHKKDFHAYVVVIRSVAEHEKPYSKEGQLKNKIIDYLSIDFNCTNNEMLVRNSTYAKETYDIIISKIHQLSEG